MATSTISKVSIRGISAAIPDKVRENSEIKGEWNNIMKTAKTVGIQTRYVANNSICTSDLCFAAADKLLDELQWDRDSVDLLIFLSQTPDYLLPATSCVLQDRLKLSTSCAAFDMSLGCSGYVYGLFTAFSMISEKGIRRALLLVGDTISKIISPDDMPANVLFGDAGTATAIEFNNEAPNSFFILGSDGKGSESLIISAGGFRSPKTEFTKLRKAHPKDQVIRSEEELFMDGSAVFSFTLTQVPNAAKQLFSLANRKIEEVDTWLFHQANLFMLDYLGKKIGVEKDKVLINIDRYGNTSPPSIPLLAVTDGKKQGFSDRRSVVSMLGFGVGFSWGAALIELDRIAIPGLIFVDEIGD